MSIMFIFLMSYPGHLVNPNKQHRMFAVINPVAIRLMGVNPHKSILTNPSAATIPSDAWHAETERSPATHTGTPATRNHPDCCPIAVPADAAQ